MDFGISYNHSSAWNDISPMFVQHGDEEQAGQNEIKKPLGPGTNQTQMAWWTQAKVECETALKGLNFMALCMEAVGMDARQANDLLTRIMELSHAAIKLPLQQLDD